MLHHINRPSLRSPLKILCVLVLHLLLTNSCRGQSQLIGPSQPIVATIGGDIHLPCQLQPAEDVSALTVEWTRSDLDPRDIHVWRTGQEVISAKHPSYKGRTSLSIDRLKQGNISLKLSEVKPSDGGKYRCYIQKTSEESFESFVELVVASNAVSSPVINLASIDKERGGAVLQCESKGWHPQPEVFWLDGEGNLLSAKPTKTVKGPDGLYTVSSRVTVEKKHSNNFTCRVIQSKTNQIRETYIIVPDDFFNVQSSCSPVIIGLAVGLALFILLIVAVSVFFVWKWRQDMTKTKKSCIDEMQPLNAAETDGEMQPETPAVSEQNKLKKKNEHWPHNWQFIDKETLQDLQQQVQTLKEELVEKKQEIETLQESEKQLKVQYEELEGKQADTDRLLQEEKQNREKEVKDLKDQLDLKQQIENKQAECDLLMKLLQLHEENQRRESDLQTLKENLETKNKEVAGMEKEKEVETLKKELQTKQEEFETKNKEIKKIKAELQQLRDENQRKETDNKELKKTQAELLQEKQNREKAEKEVKDLKDQLDLKQKKWEKKQAELLKEKQDREKEVKDLNNQLYSKLKEIKNKQAECDLLMKLLQLHEENPRRERDLQTLKENLETKTKELETMKTGRLSFKGSKKKAEEVETLQKELQTKQEEFETKTKEIETLQESEKQLKAQYEKQRKEEAETEIKLKVELEIKNKKIENKQAECDLLMKLLQLHEENQRRERDLQTLKENLETKNKELETMKTGWFSSSKEKKAEKEKEKEVETLKKELQTKQEELETKTKEIEEIKDELQQLRDENQRKETDLQRQTEETNNKETQGPATERLEVTSEAQRQKPHDVHI